MGEVPAKRWSTLSSQVVFASPWFEVRRDAAIRPDESAGHYDHVVVADAVTVIALDESGRVALTRQWIYVHGNRQWRLPAGRMDSSDADPQVAARRELVEETGVDAGRWRRLGTVHCADSFTNHRDHAFLATELSHGPARLQPGEADLEVHWLPFEQVLAMVVAGDLPHAGSAFAVLMAHALGLAAGQN